MENIPEGSENKKVDVVYNFILFRFITAILILILLFVMRFFSSEFKKETDKFYEEQFSKDVTAEKILYVDEE